MRDHVVRAEVQRTRNCRVKSGLEGLSSRSSPGSPPRRAPARAGWVMPGAGKGAEVPVGARAAASRERKRRSEGMWLWRGRGGAAAGGGGTGEQGGAVPGTGSGKRRQQRRRPPPGEDGTAAGRCRERHGAAAGGR